MAASTFLGFVPKDDPMFSGGPEIFSRLGSRQSSTDTAKSTDGATPDKSPLATNRQAGSLDPTEGMDRMTRERFGPPSPTDVSTNAPPGTTVGTLHMTQQQSKSSDKGQYAPGNLLEKMQESTSIALRGYGLTDAERAGSDGQELTASVPQGKRPVQPIRTNRQAGSLDSTDGMDRMARVRFGLPSTTDGDPVKPVSPRQALAPASRVQPKRKPNKPN